MQVYYEVLLLALEVETEGGAAYPFALITRGITSPITGLKVLIDLPEPWRTSACNNKQLMTAVEAAHRYAAMRAIELREDQNDN
jgi:hypothetical protein